MIFVGRSRIQNVFRIVDRKECVKMYIKRSVLKRYLERVSKILSKSRKFQEDLEKNEFLNVTRYLFGEQLEVGAEIFVKTEDEYLACIFAWQFSHWTAPLWCMSPVFVVFPLEQNCTKIND